MIGRHLRRELVWCLVGPSLALNDVGVEDVATVLDTAALFEDDGGI